MQILANLPKPNDYYLLDKELRMRHERALPPKEAYLYFPNEKEVIERSPKPENLLRRIFSGVVFTSYEEAKLVELNKEMRKRSIIIPKWWEEAETHRFLQATRFNINKTIQIIQQQIIWRQLFFPLTITDRTTSILNSGFMYIHGRDRHFRPIFVIQAAIYFQIREKYTYEEIFLAIIYFLEYILQHLLILGQVENWITISDLSNVSIVFMPSDLKKLLDALSSCYRCRLYKNYILGLSPGLTWLYKLATSFVDEVILKKLCVVQKDNWGVIRENIHEDNYEAKFGGNAPNIIQRDNSYFPPVMPKNHFGIPQEDNFLISEAEYKKRCNGNDRLKPLQIGQYYIEKWMCESVIEKREEVSNKAFRLPLEIKKVKTTYSIGKWNNEESNSIRSVKTTVVNEGEINNEYRPSDNYRFFNSKKLFNGIGSLIDLNHFNNSSPCMADSKKTDTPCKETSSNSTNIDKV